MSILILRQLPSRAGGGIEGETACAVLNPPPTLRSARPAEGVKTAPACRAAGRNKIFRLVARREIMPEDPPCFRPPAPSQFQGLGPPHVGIGRGFQQQLRMVEREGNRAVLEEGPGVEARGG